MATDRMVDEGRVKTALRVCREALETKGEDAGVLLRAAGLEERLGRRERAQALYLRAQQMPSCPPAFLRCAIARSSLLTFLSDGDADAACALLDESLAHDPSHLETLDVKAYVLAGSRPDQARDLHKHICRLDPSHSLVNCLYFRHIFAKGTAPYPKPPKKAEGGDWKQEDLGIDQVEATAPPPLVCKIEGTGRRVSEENVLQWGLMAGVPHQDEGVMCEEELTGAERNWISVMRGLKRKQEAVSNVQKVLIMAGLYSDHDTFNVFAMGTVTNNTFGSGKDYAHDDVVGKESRCVGRLRVVLTSGIRDCFRTVPRPVNLPPCVS
uniref:Uncharacterized protein n=1 Tax=Hemiselmis andersenii TaxID=464988 RepID=A0A7S1HMD8_HEMAN